MVEEFSPVESRPSPIVKEKSAEKFKSQLKTIEDSIEKNDLKITPEQYRNQMEDAIDFLEFDDYVNLVDKLIDDQIDRDEINCYYSDTGNQYKDEGDIPNSDVFMIRLLKARLEQREIQKKVNVYRIGDIKNNPDIKNLVILDDAVYSGSQKINSLTVLPSDVHVDIYAVGVFDEGKQDLEEELNEQNQNQNSKINYIKEIKPIGQKLSEDAKKVFIDVYEKETLGDMENVSQNDIQKVRKAAEYQLDKPMVITPFRLPDGASQARSYNIVTGGPLTEDLSPINKVDRAYIDPKFLLDIDKFEGYTKA